MTLISLFKQSNKDKNHLLIYGTNDLLNNYIMTDFVKQKQFSNYDLIYVDVLESGIDGLIATLSESSLFSLQRLIIVKNPVFLSTKFVVKDSKQLEKLKQLIDNLSILDDLIVFVANYEKIDKRKAIVKLLIKNVNVVETNFKAQEVAKILKSIAAAEKIKFIGDAFTELIKRSDNVFSLALNNYLKLKNIVEGKEILPEVVKSNIDQSLSENVFEIMTAIFNKNYVEANRRLDDQINNGLTPIALLAIFESQLEFLLCVKILQKRGWGKDQIVDELDANPYRIYYALNNRLDITRLKQSIKYAIKLDYGYKNGTYTGASFLKVYLLNI